MGFCYQRNFSNPTLPVDEAQFYALVRAGKWNEAIDQYRQTGEASLKRKLPAFACLHLPGDLRRDDLEDW